MTNDIEKLIFLKMGICRCVHEIITENIDIESLRPVDRNTIKKLDTCEVLHKLHDRLVEEGVIKSESNI